MDKATAIERGRTQFLDTASGYTSVKLVTGETNVLKRSMDNAKLGKLREWRAGAFKGMPLYSLTLEERATCERSCNAWDVCYGNNMPFAHRFDVTTDGGLALMMRLTVELDKLDKKHKTGYSIRLHILGDFFSVAYVDFWREMLASRPLLHIYGYTHRQGEIKAAIDSVWREHYGRFNIMQSDGETGDDKPIALIETTDGAMALPLCPVQAKKSSGCLDCGLCTLPMVKGVRFSIH